MRRDALFDQGVPLVAVGLVLGLTGSLAVGRGLQSMLFCVGPHDQVVFGVVPMVLAVVAAAAMLIPARRAARVEHCRAISSPGHANTDRPAPLVRGERSAFHQR